MNTKSVTWMENNYFILLELSGLQFPWAKIKVVSSGNTEEDLFLHLSQILGVPGLILPSSIF